jgi:hypothetical protein
VRPCARDGPRTGFGRERLLSGGGAARFDDLDDYQTRLTFSPMTSLLLSLVLRHDLARPPEVSPATSTSENRGDLSYLPFLHSAAPAELRPCARRAVVACSQRRGQVQRWRGGSNLTWQISLGLGYQTGWAGVSVTYCYPSFDECRLCRICIALENASWMTRNEKRCSDAER